MLNSLAFDNVQTFQEAAENLQKSDRTKAQIARGFKDIDELNELTRQARMTMDIESAVRDYEATDAAGTSTT